MRRTTQNLRGDDLRCRVGGDMEVVVVVVVVGVNCRRLSFEQ
jgi:hypothetical protein